MPRQGGRSMAAVEQQPGPGVAKVLAIFRRPLNVGQVTCVVRGGEGGTDHHGTALGGDEGSGAVDAERAKASERVRQIAETEWIRRLQMNPKLFNMSKFRLDAFSIKNYSIDAERNDRLESEPELKLELELSLTDYKTFLGTNCNPSEVIVSELRSLGTRMANDERAFMADPLGVGAIVEIGGVHESQTAKTNKTARREMLLIHRSHHTGEFQGFLDLPGGHPEPSRVDENNSTEQELFGSIIDEVRAEINLPVSSLAPPELFALVRQVGPSQGKPSALFVIRCACTRDEVLRRYSKGGEEAGESTRLVFIPLDDLAVTSFAIESQMFAGAPLTPQALAALSWVQTDMSNREQASHKT